MAFTLTPENPQELLNHLNDKLANGDSNRKTLQLRQQQGRRRLNGQRPESENVALIPMKRTKFLQQINYSRKLGI